MRCTTYVFCFGLALQVNGLRVSDEVDIDTVSGNDEACVASLKEVHKGSTLNRLFRPLLQGQYRIRNRYTNKYLTATEKGVGTSRVYEDSSGWSLWNLRRVQKKGFPTYTLANKHTRGYLAWGDGSSLTATGEKTPWYFEPDPEGIYNVISSDENTTQRVVEDTTANVLVTGTGSEDKYENWKSHWEFELVGKPKGRVWPRKARGEYRFQWTQASNIPMFKGGTFTWADMCEEAGQETVCPNGYADLREFYLSIDKVVETGGNNIPTESAIGQCDAPIGLSKQMFSLPKLVREVQKLAWEYDKSCAGLDTRQISRLMRQGIEEECLNGCMEKIKEKVKVFDCAASNADNWNKLGSDVFDKLECDVSPSTLLYLIDFTLQDKCWKWKSPSPLWMPADHGPGKTNLAKADEDAVCKMKTDGQSSRWSSNADAFEKPKNYTEDPEGQHCIEGTSCGCPKTWRKRYETLSEKRVKSSPSTRGVKHPTVNLKEAPNFFIANDDIGLRNILNTMSKSLFIGTSIKVVFMSQTLGAALLATPFGAPFVIQTGIALFGYLKAFGKWTCDQSLGCWPQEPERIRTKEQSKACRLPEETKDGGSKVWFMPPPGFTLFHRGGFFRLRKCVLKYCSKKDMLAQRVEFGEAKRNVYNCQPLSYDDMNEAQKGNYTATLRTTIPTEYAKLI